MKTGFARSGLPLLLFAAAVLLAGCGAGYDYNPRAINCSLPENASICHPNFMP